MSDPEMQRLETAFEAEREALREGRLGDLETLSAARDAALAAIRSRGPGEAELARIRALAERNRLLAQAAQAGVESALGRVKAIEGAAGPINGYTETGEPVTIGGTRAKVERKA